MNSIWKDKEFTIHIENMEPGGVGGYFMFVAPTPKSIQASSDDIGRPFKLCSLLADGDCAGDFRIVQCFVGANPVFEEEDGAPLNALITAEPVAGIGSAVAVYIRNVSGECKTFSGRMSGQQLFDE